MPSSPLDKYLASVDRISDPGGMQLRLQQLDITKNMRELTDRMIDPLGMRRMHEQFAYANRFGALAAQMAAPIGADSAIVKLLDSPLHRLMRDTWRASEPSAIVRAIELNHVLAESTVFAASRRMLEGRLNVGLERLMSRSSFLLADDLHGLDVASSLAATDSWLRWVQDPTERRKAAKRHRRGGRPAPLRPEQTQQLGEFIVAPDNKLVTLDDVSGLALPPADAAALEAVDFVPLRLLRELRATPDLLYAIEPRKFEEVVAEILHRLGHDVQLTPRSDDGGRDVIAATTVNGIRIALYFECRRHKRSRAVKLAELRALLGVISHDARGVNKGVLVTTSRFTKGGMKLIAEDIRLGGVDYHGILRWMDEALG